MSKGPLKRALLRQSECQATNAQPPRDEIFSGCLVNLKCFSDMPQQHQIFKKYNISVLNHPRYFATVYRPILRWGRGKAWRWFQKQAYECHGVRPSLVHTQPFPPQPGSHQPHQSGSTSLAGGPEPGCFPRCGVTARQGPRSWSR